jgi:fatty-acyl-CoA synthase
MKKSYVAGLTDVPLLQATLGEAFDNAVRRWSSNTALVSCHEKIRWTWAEFGDRVDAFAKGLLALGFIPGDRIGVWATNQADWTVVQFATAKIGAILVNINPAYRPSELEYVLNKVGCKGVVTGTRFKSSDYIKMLQELLPELHDCAPGQLKAAKAPQLQTVIRLGSGHTSGMFNFGEVLQLAEQVEENALADAAMHLGCHDAINIQFTSGTTGAPKGATLSHHNILNNANIIGNNLRYTPEDVVCNTVPLYHCFGMVAGNLTAITHGVRLVYPSEVFEAEATLQAVVQEGCTSMYGVPTMFLAAIDHPNFKNYDVSTLRTGIMAGAPCPMELMKRVIHDYHLPEITIGYGMTETSPISYQGHTDDALDKRVGTVGQVVPHTEVKVVDVAGETVPCGVQGEVLTRGYCVMKGYWDDEAKNAECIEPDGWIHSGDLGTMDENGWLRITGRLKDMVIRGGENVYPREIEEFLYTHPKIHEVQVFGVPDAKFGEEIAAWIELHPGEELSADEIRAFCKGTIAYYKVPRYIKFVHEFPMTVTGKIQKFEMRNAMTRELNLGLQKSA